MEAAFANRVVVSFSNQTLTLEFYYKDPDNPDRASEITPIKKIVMERSGSELFLANLSRALQTPPPNGTSRV